MKLTRRQMVAAATAGSVVAAKAVAQSSSASPADFEKQARDNVKNNADVLAKFALPMAVEPAFQFKA